MTALYILGGVVVMAALILRVPIGAEIAYDGALSFAFRVWFISIRTGKKKEKKPKKKAETKPEPEKKKKGMPPFAVLKMLAGSGYDVIGRILSRFTVDYLRIRFTSAFEDPATAAMAYGAAGTAMETLIALGGARLKKADLHADVDFDKREPSLDFRMRLTLRVGDLSGAGVRFVFRFLREYIPYKREERKMSHGKQSHR